ncbi:hypothetical protein B0H10DRAFT_2079651 [Mycena sp. CBHHK59/15]|nr:hypothetical protein B0H10DRAFT_2079651 [Mycena sp. CBHHK59/15]
MNLFVIPISFGVLFLCNITLVHGKGGGKGHASSGNSGGSSTSKGTGGSGTGAKSGGGGTASGGSTVTIIHTGGTTVCYDQNNQVIRCPPNSHRKNLIIGAVIGSICGAILIACLTFWLVRRMRNKRRQGWQKTTKVPSPAFGKQEYKPLHDESEDHV